MCASTVRCSLLKAAVGCVLVQLLGPSCWGNEIDSIALFSLDGKQIPPQVQSINANVQLVSGTGVAEGRQALEVAFAKEHSESGIEFSSEEPWDCRQLGKFRFTFEATNPGETSIHIYCTVVAASGGNQRRSVCIPAHSEGTYYFELKGDNISEDRGMRDDPSSLHGIGTKMVVQGIKFNVNFDKIKAIRLYTIDLLENKKLVIENVGFESNPPIDSNYLKGFVDKFGQNAKVDFDIKVHSEAHLKQLAKQEQEQLAQSTAPAQRSKFGGWKDGPQLQATGYFRTQKIGRKWALIDPEGYLFFSTGIDNVRMDNTSTFTGVDYVDSSVKQGGSKKVARTRSRLLLSGSRYSRKDRVISSEMRNKMFSWLPSYDDPLSKCYGYRNSSLRGPMKRGEIFSFYRANLMRRYGDDKGEGALSRWRDVTVERMIEWGFTSLGNWADPMFYQLDRIPYFANGWVRGDFKTVSSGNDYWHPLPDVFDPVFERSAKRTARKVADEVQDNPWCVGVFIDNEKSWGTPGTVKKHYGIVIDSLARDAAESPTKAEFVRILMKKYSSIDGLNRAWETGFDSWEMLARGVDHWDIDHNDRIVADYSMLLEAYASRYFKLVHDALEEVMPNHLYLGVRFTPWGMTPETREAARKYCDVVSINYYREGLGREYWKFLEELDMPCIIGEFHMGSTDTGIFHPGLIIASDQKDRARMWKIYMESLVANPYFVGGHWFQYVDSPLTGRALDGENYNVGFVTVADIPYPHMIRASKEFHKSLYERRYGDIVSE